MQWSGADAMCLGDASVHSGHVTLWSTAQLQTASEYDAWRNLSCAHF